MLRVAILLFAASLTLGFFRCSNGEPNPPSNSFSPGDYAYSGLDSNGKQVISGTLKLVEVKDGRIKGTWDLKQVGPGEKLGPQIGTGDFAGTIGQDGGIYIDLNPGTADNNIFLNGKFENGELRGNWHYSTFAGPTTKGIFTARRK
jgi:hypothetical protein